MTAAMPALEPLRRNSGWLLALGIGLVILGTIALGAAVAVTIASVVVLGCLLLISGVIEAIQAFHLRGTSGIVLHLVSAVLSIVLGFLFVTEPVEGSLALTVLIAAFLLVGGVFRVVAALSVQVEGRGLAIFGGIVTAILGLLVWSELPGSALWLIGTFLGIDLIFRGWWTVALALRLRKVP
jgi:uncharacterized membrane protein HdeD (DUF308 family)